MNGINKQMQLDIKEKLNIWFPSLGVLQQSITAIDRYISLFPADDIHIHALSEELHNKVHVFISNNSKMLDLIRYLAEKEIIGIDKRRF